jgi:hypothetical protein
MSGFSDEFYRQMTAFYQNGRVLEGPKPYYRTGAWRVWWVWCVVLCCGVWRDVVV